MKIFLSVLLLSVSIQNSMAMSCYGCEMSNSSECNFSYKCPKGTDYCEALLSKVNGKYSLIFSCATMEKCGMNSVNQGFNKCDHHKPNAECFSCCDDDKCNKVDAIMKQLPKDIFEPQSNSLDYDRDYDRDYENGEMRNEEDFLKNLEEMIEKDEKKLERGENVSDKASNETSSRMKPGVMTTPKPVGTSTTEMNLNATSVRENSTSATTTQSLEVKTTELVNATTTTFNLISESNETQLEVPLDEVLINRSDDFSGEHHALTGSSSSKFSPEILLLLVNLLVAFITNFAD